MSAPWAALFGSHEDLASEQAEDECLHWNPMAVCRFCGEEFLHWEEWRTSRRWTLCNSFGDVHECPPVDASTVFQNLDQEGDDGRLQAELG